MSEQLEANKQVVQNFLGAVCVGDAALLNELSSEEFRYEIMGTTVLAGVRGKQELLEIAGMIDQFVDGELVLEQQIITAEEDRVAFAARGRSKLVNGEDYNNTYHLLFRVTDGKVTHLYEYIDTKYTDEVLSPLMQQA